MGLKHVIDIEDLLIWAYRDQCVDRMTQGFTPRGPSASPANALAQYLALGTRVDNSGAAAKALGVRLPDDALIVHDAVLALDDMFVEWRDGDGVVIWDETRACDAQSLICEDRTGFYLLHASDQSVARLTRAVTSVLLITHARTALRPECYQDWRATAGRPANDHLACDKWGRKRKRSEGHAPTFAEVMHHRAQYRVWHAALAVLALDLDELLSDHSVTGPLAPDSPWTLRAGRVLQGAKLQNVSISKLLLEREKIIA